jgi:hypothetical protein
VLAGHSVEKARLRRCFYPAFPQWLSTAAGQAGEPLVICLFLLGGSAPLFARLTSVRVPNLRHRGSSHLYT